MSAAVSFPVPFVSKKSQATSIPQANLTYEIQVINVQTQKTYRVQSSMPTIALRCPDLRCTLVNVSTSDWWTHLIEIISSFRYPLSLSQISLSLASKFAAQFVFLDVRTLRLVAQLVIGCSQPPMHNVSKFTSSLVVLSSSGKSYRFAVQEELSIFGALTQFSHQWAIFSNRYDSRSCSTEILQYRRERSLTFCLLYLIAADLIR